MLNTIKRIRTGGIKHLKLILFIVLLTFSTLFLITCTIKHHSVEIYPGICIIPTQGYQYKTCDAINVDIDGKLLVIPKGYRTDLASVPRALWVVMSPAKSEIMAASVLHDFLYEKDCYYTRKMADDIFYLALLKSETGQYTAAKIYLAVRLFGASHFKKCPS